MIWKIVTALLALVAIVAAVPAVRHLRELPPPAPPALRATLDDPAGATLGAGDVPLDAAFSPDGRTIAFVATSAGRVQLWRRPIDGQRAEALAGTDGALMPAWKPGGRAIAFFADGLLKQIALPDRGVRTLTPAATAGGATWQTDGSLLFATGTGPIRLLRGGVVTDATRLASGDRVHSFPVATDDGGFVYMAIRADGSRLLRYTRGTEQIDLGPTSSHGEVVDDVLVHVRDGVLLAQRIDPERHTLAGRATVLEAAAGATAAGRGFFAVSPRVVLSAPPGDTTRALTWIDARGTPGMPLAEPGAYWQVRLSPDDRRAAVTALDPLLRTLDVFAFPLGVSGRPERASLSLSGDSDPVWSPDGARIAYRSTQAGAPRVLARRIGTAAEEEVLPGSEADDTPTDWRGRHLLLEAPSPGSGIDLWLLDEASGVRTRVTRGGFNERAARWSPDGRWIAFVSDETGHAEVYVARWPAVDRRVRLSFAGGEHPRWANDGQGVYFMRDNEIFRATRQNAAPGDDKLRLRDDGFGFTVPESVVRTDALIDFDVAHRSARLAVVAGVHRAVGRVGMLANWRSEVPQLAR